MNTIKTLVVSLVGRGAPARLETAKARVRQALACESLEGRQLLNGAWGISATGTPPADVHHWDKAGAGGAHTFTPPNLSASAQADLKTLQADEKTLMGEIKADTNLAPMTAALKADRAVIEKALGVTATTTVGHDSLGFINGTDASIAPDMHGLPGHGPMGKGLHPGAERFMQGPGGPGGPGFNGTLPAPLVTKLEAKGITATQISGFEADLKAIQTEIQSVDTTLQAKIKTDRAALAKDAPAPLMHFDHAMHRAPGSATTTTTSKIA